MTVLMTFFFFLTEMAVFKMDVSGVTLLHVIPEAGNGSRWVCQRCTVLLGVHSPCPDAPK